MLTDENDVVLDIFSGSNTTGEAAENSNRRWLSFEMDRNYVANSAFRFLDKDYSETELKRIYDNIIDNVPVDLSAVIPNENVDVVN